MSRIFASIKDLVNAPRVYAALENQQLVPGTITATSNGHSYHKVVFKRQEDNHEVVLLLMPFTEGQGEETEPYGPPYMHLQCHETPSNIELVKVILAYFGGRMELVSECGDRSEPEYVDRAVPATWYDNISRVRRVQIKLIDAFGGQGAELLSKIDNEGSEEFFERLQKALDYGPVQRF